MSNQIQELQDLIKDKQDAVDTAVSLNRLVKNRDFIKIIEKGYFEKEAIKLVMLKAEFAQQTPESQADIMKRIDAIGELRNYLTIIIAKGREADNRIEEAKQSIQYLTTEQDDNEDIQLDDAYTA